MIVEPLHPSPLEKLLELKPSALERVPVRQFMSVDEPGDGDQVRVLARWNNPARSPAVIERTLGDGRVLLWTTTADRAGNDWPIEPSFVLAVREAVRGAARPTRLVNTVTAGERMRRVVRSSHQIVQRPVELRPAAASPESLSAVPRWPRTRASGTPAVEINVPDTRQAGFYRIAWDEGSARNPAGYLTRPTPTRARARSSGSGQREFKSLSPLEVEIVRARSDDGNLLSPIGREIWHELAAVCSSC